MGSLNTRDNLCSQCEERISTSHSLSVHTEDVHKQFSEVVSKVQG